MKSILLTILVIGFSSSFSAQMQKGSQFSCVQVSGPVFSRDRRDDNGNSKRLTPQAIAKVGFHYAFSERWVAGVSFSLLFDDSLGGFGGGIDARYYFDFSKKYHYPHFFLEAGYTFSHGTDRIGSFSASQPGIYFGQTLRRRREAVPISELRSEPFLSRERMQNYFRHLGFEYGIGVEVVTAPHRETSVLPVIRLSVLVFAESKSWAKPSRKLD